MRCGDVGRWWLGGRRVGSGETRLGADGGRGGEGGEEYVGDGAGEDGAGDVLAESGDEVIKPGKSGPVEVLRIRVAEPGVCVEQRADAAVEFVGLICGWFFPP